jgi:DNA-binding MarR family transcriptional regulator
MKQPQREETIENAVSRLQEFFRALQIATSPAWLELSMTMGQWRSLLALQVCGTTSLSGLAKRLGVGAPTASVVVDQLVQLGYVDRTTDPADRRRIMLTVAPAGEELLVDLRHGRAHILEMWLDGLTDNQLKQLSAGLYPLVRAIVGDDSPAGAGPATGAPSQEAEA